MGERAKRFYQFGPFLLDTLKRVLLREGQVVPLAPRAFDMLLVLVRSAGKVLSKDELMRRVWPDTFVGENNLTVIISALRLALGETYNEHSYIVTIPGTGYRFVAPVKDLPEAEVGGPVADKGTLATGAWSAAPANHVIRSIAVLPFKPLPGQNCEPYLGVGIADALITRLGALRQIVVRPTSAVLKYASRRQNPIVAGRALAVDSVLDAHFQRVDDRIRITLQFIRVTDGAQLWSEVFDDEFTNLFVMQDRISQRVVHGLMLKLNDDEKERLAKRDTKNSEAYQLYLYGRYFWNKRTAEALKKAISYFEEAAAKDASYALAYAGLADCYCVFDIYGIQPPSNAFPKAKAACLQALRLDDGLAEAHASLGYLQAVYEWNWVSAEKEYQRAIKINPNYSTAHQWYAGFLAAMGRDQEAQVEIGRALELNPLSFSGDTAAGLILYFGRRYDQAIEHLTKAVQLEAGYWPAHWLLAWCLAAKKLYTEAVSEIETAHALSGNTPRTLAEVAYIHAVGNNKVAAQQIVTQLRDLGKRAYVSNFSLAVIEAARGRNKEALDYLCRAVEERPWDFMYLNQDPKLDPLRKDPRFVTLIQRLGLASSPSPTKQSALGHL